MEKRASKLKVLAWGFKLGWQINKKLLILWYSISIGLSVLPAIALKYNKEIVRELSGFIATGAGSYQDVVPYILTYGFIFILIGLSARVNRQLVYSIMYDSYYVGMQGVLMDCFHKIEMVDLFRKDINDEYTAVLARGGSLTDVMSCSCNLVGNVVGIISLLFVAFDMSKIIFLVSFLYTVGVVILNTSFVEKIRWNTLEVVKIERLSNYYENMARKPGVAKEVRIFNIKDYILKRWKEAYQSIKAFHSKRVFNMELRTFISGFVFYVFLLVMLTYALFEVSKGKMTVDVFIIIYTLCLNIYTTITQLAKNFMATDYGMYALERQYNFIHNVPKIDFTQEQTKTDKVVETDPVFEAKNVSFNYSNGTKALKNISLRINKGEVIALVGKNGSGKSTLVKLLLDLYPPTSGEMLFYNTPYKNLKRGVVGSKIGVFFQDFYLFHLPVYKNIGLGNVAEINNLDKIKSAVTKGGADNVIGKLPYGLNTFIGKKVEKLGIEPSGGEKQRIAVARAHMSEREIMIFDEPAAMLDPIAELEQFKNIKQKVDQKTAILISHRIGFARLADRIIVLDKGEIVEQGNHVQLMANKGLYAYLFNEQAQWYETAKGGISDEA